ncbi:MAG: NAD-dependent epimerase/dehydratase family protein [Geminicoccaceae bacterium]
MGGPGRGAGRLLVVGHHSFIARHFLQACREPVIAVGHEAIARPDLLDGVDRIVSFARHPLLGRADYRPATMDPDLRLAARIAGQGIDYVMLSSRKVYAPSTGALAESDPVAPRDLYGRHKLAAEQALGERLGTRLTILRLANVFGDERQAGRRTFFALTLEALAREGRIRFEMSPFVMRDFLPVAACARVLAQIAAAPPGGVLPGGILNVGSGIALPTGRLALWVLEGYGRGELVIESPEEKDAFVLDVGRLRARYGEPTTLAELRESCLDLGRRLAADVGEYQAP